MNTVWKGLLTAAVLAMPVGAQGQTYPSQDIHFIAAFPAGSGADVIVRYFAEKVRPLAGRTIIVENKVGAQGNIAAEYTARSKPDGHTIFVHAASGVASNLHILKNATVNGPRDIQIAAGVNQQPFMLVVPAQSPYKTLAELTEAMKAKGEKASYAQSNATGKVIGELYKLATGVKAVDIPYRTANDSVNDFKSGNIDFGVLDPVFAAGQQRAGVVRMLAVTTPKRMQSVPELPTLMELGVPVGILNWFAAMVPIATPKPVVNQINAWFNEVGKTEETRKFLNSFGSDPNIITPEEGQAMLIKDTKDWGDWIKAAKIEPQG